MKLSCRCALPGLLLGMLCAMPLSAQDADPWSFVVLGHVRGWNNALHPRLGELLAEVRTLGPDLVVLAGDQIWGDMGQVPRRRSAVEKEWSDLDSALATVGVPRIQVPGNHEINDLVTRDVYRERFGDLPRSVTMRNVRFLLLNSVWIPEDGDTTLARNIRGVDLDSAQVRWLREELARPDAPPHTVVVLHHLLWWGGEGDPWWRDVHPLLRQAGVRAVFSGDHGPLKFSHREQDGVAYYQVSIGGDPSLAILRDRESSRTLAAQFDSFLRVQVDGAAFTVDVETTGEVSSGHFTPQHYRDVHEFRPPPRPRLERLWEAINRPARLAALGLLVLGSIGLGVVIGRRTTGSGE